jgi:hypothetical protein
MSNPPSSPFRHGTTVEQELAYYKAQYEQLEVELQEFQQSSRELEAELEKDVEASEKRERKLKERVESLGFEVEEWKVRMLPLSPPRMHLLTAWYRPSTNNQRPRRTRRKPNYRKKSPPCARPTGRYN